MPHVIVKMLPGRSDEQKRRIAEAITQAVMTHARCAESSVSVDIEDVSAEDWTEQVYEPAIRAHWDRLYKQAGYEPD